MLEYVIAKYDYQSQGPQELSIKKGDRLQLVDDTRHWWKVLAENNTSGFVPSNYVKKEKHSIFDSIKRNIRGSSGSSSKLKKTPISMLVNSKPSPSKSPLILPNKNDKVADHSNSNNKPPLPIKQQSHSDILVQELGADFNGFCISPANDNSKQEIRNEKSTHSIPTKNKTDKMPTAYVKYNYKSNQPDEISLTKGCSVIVLDKSDDGWWKGELDGKSGWFPSNYVIENIDETLPETTDNLETNLDKSSESAKLTSQNAVVDKFSRSSGLVQNKPNDVVVALYSFQSQNPEELTFEKDEYLEIIDKPMNDPDWWKACNRFNVVGLVPKNYVEIVPGLNSLKELPIQTQTNNSLNQHGSPFNNNGMPSQDIDSKQSELTNEKTIDYRAINASFDLLSPSNFKDPSLDKSAKELEQRLNLSDKIWYHGVMSRPQCDQILNGCANDGDFLIRNSETSAGDFSVSLKAPGKNKHFRVHYMDNLFCIGQRQFSSLDELVEHYKRTSIYTGPNGEKMFLQNPYPRLI